MCVDFKEGHLLHRQRQVLISLISHTSSHMPTMTTTTTLFHTTIIKKRCAFFRLWKEKSCTFLSFFYRIKHFISSLCLFTCAICTHRLSLVLCHILFGYANWNICEWVRRVVKVWIIFQLSKCDFQRGNANQSSKV